MISKKRFFYYKIPYLTRSLTDFFIHFFFITFVSQQITVMKKSILSILFISSLFACDRGVDKKQCWECYVKITDLKGGNAISTTEEHCKLTADEIADVQKEAYSKTPASSILNIKCDPKN